MTMQHHFAYPKVQEIRRVRPQRLAHALGRLSQRELVQASLVRCPERAEG
jgi:hypothetical protein